MRADMLQSRLAASFLLFAVGCALAGPPSRPAPLVRDCARRLEDPLATLVNTSPGPYAVYVVFERAPLLGAWASMGFVDCGADQACVGRVQRYKLLRLCNDANVRDIEAWE
jgi:hypothetical protein